MSIEASVRSGASLTPTSYLVLGLLAREGPSTPYELKRHVAATIGHFWSFPHALLYKEPPRLVSLGLLTEEREEAGRRRRLFTITTAGEAALRDWLARPARAPTELRDLGLLQLFFADLEPPSARRTIAAEQLVRHRAQLAGYEAGQRADERSPGAGNGSRTVEHWRGATLPIGLLYERAAIQFWAGVAGDDAEIANAAEVADGSDRPARAERPGSADRRDTADRRDSADRRHSADRRDSAEGRDTAEGSAARLAGAPVGRGADNRR
jgi:PadR family transcriptional regulator, regulatory protein AphA